MQAREPRPMVPDIQVPDIERGGASLSRLVPSAAPVRLRHPARAQGKKIVVVVGAGFAGLAAAKRLGKQAGVQVVLLDQRNHHLFQPLLYQVATAGLNPADIAAPIRSQFKAAKNVEVHLGRVAGADLDQGYVYGGGIEVEYDYLVVATGAQHSYFGHDEWEPFAPGLKTLEQATEIRRRLLSAFELAENELDPEKQKAALTFVVVGGGPTGVELAGAIADISRTVMVADFRRIDPSHARVLLVEGLPRLLAGFPEVLSARAQRDLEELGVEVRTGAMVEEIDATGVRIGSERISAQSVFWAAGVQAARFEFKPAVPTDRAGRVKVQPDLSLSGYPTVFVLGDMASLTLPDGKPLPGLAPAAQQTGRYCADVIMADLRQKHLSPKPRAPFNYRDKGMMATVGKSRAVAVTGRLQMTGLLAWLAWLFVHLYFLIGFKNRIAVLVVWAYSYLFSKRGSRLITEREWRLRD
jgi:NADH:ubiquinone reductase (H+-translocating)